MICEYIYIYRKEVCGSCSLIKPSSKTQPRQLVYDAAGPLAFDFRDAYVRSLLMKNSG